MLKPTDFPHLLSLRKSSATGAEAAAAVVVITVVIMSEISTDSDKEASRPMQGSMLQHALGSHMLKVACKSCSGQAENAVGCLFNPELFLVALFSAKLLCYPVYLRSC